MENLADSIRRLYQCKCNEGFSFGEGRNRERERLKNEYLARAGGGSGDGGGGVRRRDFRPSEEIGGGGVWLPHRRACASLHSLLCSLSLFLSGV